MILPRTAALCELSVIDETASTNDVLIARASDAVEFTVVLTTNQTAGRGRLGRVWVAAPGDGIAMSVLLRPSLRGVRTPLPTEYWGWIPLIAGVAMTRAIAKLVPGADVSLKWPNDVHVGGHKVSGILTELIGRAEDHGNGRAPGAPGGVPEPGEGEPALIVGLGVNLETAADRLPTTQSTSLRLAGVALHGDELVDAVASGWLTRFRELWVELLAIGESAAGDSAAGVGAADVSAAGDSATGDSAAGHSAHGGIRQRQIHSAVTAVCATIGRRVRVQLPGGGDLIGLAVGLDETGRLLVRADRDPSGRVTAVAAGDVTHLRYE